MQPSNFITTYKKHRFSPLCPQDGDIDIEDIAHALSFMCRANGHLEIFFSVAQHSINCANEVAARGYGAEVVLAALLHDASEAYLADIVRPVKLSLPDYLVIEKQLQVAICKAFHVAADDETRQIVAKADDAMLFGEFLVMAGEQVYPEPPEIISRPDYTQRDHLAVEREFLSLYHSLQQKRGFTGQNT
jgi:5'-deoxynucleotidase YfbR-like HD superfamily hydrolase